LPDHKTDITEILTRNSEATDMTEFNVAEVRARNIAERNEHKRELVLKVDVDLRAGEPAAACVPFPVPAVT
jgi:hypothetical protein